MSKCLYKGFLAALVLASAMLAPSCSRDRKSVEIASEEDLSGHKVGVVAGGCYDMELSMRDDIELVRYSTESDQIQSLVNGETDVCVHDETAFNAQICKELGVKVAFKGDKSFPTGFGFRKEDEDLVGKFNLMLEKMRTDGTLDSLLTFWLNPQGFDSEALKPYPNDGDGELLKIGCAISLAPLEFMKEGKWYGLECDIMYRFGTYLDRPVKFLRSDISSIMLALKTSAVDVMMGGIFITEERQKQFCFTDPYHYFTSAYFVRNDEARVKKSGWEAFRSSLYNNLIKEKRWMYLVDGLLMTIRITLLAILFGSLLGACLCAMGGSRRKWMRGFASVYNWFMAGIPMLVLLLIFFYIVFAGSGLDATVVAIVAFSMNFASGASSVFRAALDSVPRGQTEAALALGFTKPQTLLRVVFPQAIRSGMPLFKGQCISLLKGTSIVGYIAIQDLTRAGDIIRSRTFDALFPLLLVTVLYFVLAWLIGLILDCSISKKSQK